MAHGPDQSRRRFIKAGIVSAPVVVTLAARPAWAQQPGPTGYTPYAEPGTSPAQPPVFPGVRHVSPTGRGERLG
jgi:hypothetical protein